MSIDYRQLRQSLQIEDVLSWMSWRAISRSGDQLRGPCPFCTTASIDPSDAAPRTGTREFSVHRQRNIYRCFRCGSSGNALDLWSAHRKLPIYSAAQEIQTRLSENKQP